MTKSFRTVCITETCTYARCISVEIEADSDNAAIEIAADRHENGDYNDKFDAAITEYCDCIDSTYEIENELTEEPCDDFCDPAKCNCTS